MSHVSIHPSQLSAALKGDLEGRGAAVERGIKRGMNLGVTYLKQQTPVDQGIMRNAWCVSGEAVVNDAPHAGIVEAGARPHKVNKAGIQALYEWVVRHGMVKELKGPGRGKQGPPQLKVVSRQRIANNESFQKEALSIAWAIAKKIEKSGQKATWFVRDALPHLNEFVKNGIEAEMALVTYRKEGI